MSPRGELKRRGAFRLLAGIITEARTASWGSIQRLSSPEKMPGCSSREARLNLSSRRPASVINASANIGLFFIFIRVGPPFGVPPNRLKTSNIGVMCRVSRLNDHGRLQATWCLSAESRSAAGRPSAPSAPLRAHEHRPGGSVATRKSVGKRSRYRSPSSAYVTQQTLPINVAPAKTLISAILQSCYTIWS